MKHLDRPETNITTEMARCLVELRIEITLLHIYMLHLESAR